MPNPPVKITAPQPPQSGASKAVRVRRTKLSAAAAADVVSETLRREQRQIAGLCELWRAAPHVEPSRLLPMIAERVTTAMQAHTCSLLLRDGNHGGGGGDTLRMAASVGLPQEVADSVTVLVGERIAGRVAATGQPILLNKDPRSHPLLARNPDGTTTGDIAPRPEVESALCAPLTGPDGAALGVFCVSRLAAAPENAPGFNRAVLPFTENDLRLFSLFAAQAGALIAQARTRAAIAQAAEVAARKERAALPPALSALAAAITQEIHDPLAAIKGAAQFLLREIGGSGSDAPGTSETLASSFLLRDFLGIVVDEADSLGRLTVRLQEIVRAAEVHAARHDLAALTRAQVALLRPEIQRAGVSALRESYPGDGPAWVTVDGETIAQAVRNLLRHAANSSGGGKARLHICLTRESGTASAGYALCVECARPGAPRDEAPLTEGAQQRFGLERAQARQTALAHGGSLETARFSSHGDSGTRFTLRVPALETPPL